MLENIPGPVWLDGVLYVPVFDERLIAAARAQVDTSNFAHTDSDELQIDATTRVLALRGKRTRLTRIEFAILTRLLDDGEQTVTLETLLKDVWGWSRMHGGAALVRTHIRAIRIKLAEIGVPQDALKNVRSLGYSFSYPSSSNDHNSRVVEFKRPAGSTAFS